MAEAVAERQERERKLEKRVEAAGREVKEAERSVEERERDVLAVQSAKQTTVRRVCSSLVFHVCDHIIMMFCPDENVVCGRR